MLFRSQGRSDRKLVEVKRSISLVPDTQPLRELFSQFLDERKHIAVLVDQYGGMAGIVTMEDVVESLLGSEIVDESDVEIDMQKLARRRWERRAHQMGVADALAPAPQSEQPAEGGERA